MSGYQAVAPLVLVKTESGQVDYHYQGSFIPRLSEEQRERFLAEGFVVEVGNTADSAEGGAGDPGARPKQTAHKDAWVDFRVGQGVDRDEAGALTKQELIDLGE